MPEEYLTWEDFLDVEDNSIPDYQADTDDSSLQLEDLLHDPSVPRELRELLEEKKRLEKQLMGLTGEDDGGEDPDEERNRLRYPVKVHTKESRLMDKRIDRQDESRRIANKRTQEKRLENLRRERDRLEMAIRRRDRSRKEAAVAEIRERQLKKRAVQRKITATEKEKFVERRDQDRIRALQSAGIRRMRDAEKQEVRREEAKRQRIFLSTQKGKPSWDEGKKEETDDDLWEKRRERSTVVDRDELRDRKRLGWDS